MNDYKVLNTFESCGNTYMTVIINGNACVMTEDDYNEIVEIENGKFAMAA